MSSTLYQAFWGLNLGLKITEVDGVLYDCMATLLPRVNPDFLIVKDDTGANVLLVKSDVPVRMPTFDGVKSDIVTSTSQDYIGGRPPHRIL